jgi:hypothetical protein
LFAIACPVGFHRKFVGAKFLSSSLFVPKLYTAQTYQYPHRYCIYCYDHPNNFMCDGWVGGVVGVKMMMVILFVIERVFVPLVVLVHRDWIDQILL